jgi:signal transduction histidine kinase
MSKRLRFSIALILVVFITNFLYSQNTYILDSLKNMIHNTPENDTLKPRYINDLVWRIKFSDPDTSLILLDQSEKLSKKLDFADGLGNSYNSRAVIYTVKGKFDSAMIYYNLAIEQFKRINDPHGVAFCVGNIAVMFNFQSNFDSSMFYNLKALKIRKENSLDKEVAKSNINIGVVYFEKGYFETSLKYYLDALDFYENMSDKVDVDYNNLAIVYSNLGNVYQEMAEYDNAKHFYYRALEIYMKFGDNRVLSNIYNNLGDIEKVNGDGQMALGHYKKAFSLSKEIDEKQEVLISCVNLSIFYTETKKFDSANSYIVEGLKYGEEINDKKHTIRLYISSGNILKQQGELHKAIGQFDQALALSDEAGIIKNRGEIYLALSEIYSGLNQTKKAFENYKLYAAAKDSVLNKEKHRQITDMATKYESAQKDKEIALQNLEIEKQQVRINRQKARQNIYVAGVIILVLVLVFIVVWFVQKKKHREELHRRRLEEQKQEEQLKAIKQSLEAGEQERIRLADQLHDDIAPLLVGLRNSINEIGDRFPDVPVFKKISDNISIVHSEVRNISHVLYPFSISGDNFTESIQNYIDGFVHANAIEVNTKIQDSGKLNQLPHGLQNFIYRSVQELMNNVVKHTGATEIKLDISQKSGELKIALSDNGKGFRKSEKQDGIGLRRIKKGLEVFGGTMQIENKKLEGTIVNIEILVGKERVIA